MAVQLAGGGDSAPRWRWATAVVLSVRVQFDSISRGQALYWDKALPVIVQYHGNGFPMPNLNSMYIQTTILR